MIKSGLSVFLLVETWHLYFGRLTGLQTVMQKEQDCAASLSAKSTLLLDVLAFCHTNGDAGGTFHQNVLTKFSNI